MEFGVNFFPVVDPAEKSATKYYDESLRLTKVAEALGFEHVQTVEHYFSAYGGYSPDPVTFLAAVAAQTTRIRVVTGAVIAAFTHPLKLAGKLAMLDHLSHGRLDVGFGRGFLPDEFEAFQVPMDSSKARFAETVEAVRRLWTEENVVWDGQFHQFGPVSMLPRPYQQPHPPIFVASATSAESCAAAGTAGHHLQVVPSVTSREALQENIAGYRAAYAAAGHAGAPRIQIKYTCYLSEDRSEALVAGAHYEQNYIDKMAEAIASWAGTHSDAYPGYEKFIDKVRAFDFKKSLQDNKVLAGTVEDVRSQLETVREWFGDDLCVSLQFNPGAMPFEQSLDAIELFGREVMPHFTPAGQLQGVR